MIDVKFLREHFAEVKQNNAHRSVNVDLDAWLPLDAQRLALSQEIDALRMERNSIADAMKTATERDALVARGKELKELIAGKETEYRNVDEAWLAIMLQIPNLTHPETPIGATDGDNKELRKVGTVRKLSSPKSHVEIAEKYDLIDFPRAAKVAGAKWYFLKGKLVRLEQALIAYTLDVLAKEGFILLGTPDVAKDDVLVGTGYSPRGPETQIYSIENTDLSLIGTAEITIGGYHKDEMLPVDQLPLKYAGLSHCYRTEAGAYGKESYGLYRVHQFSKVEMFVFCTPEQSEALHLELLRIEEFIFSSLGIPFRVIDNCSGDLGGPAYRKYDLEAWMWGRADGKGDFGEVTSASNCTDYQARRLNVRTKTEEGSVFVHTLNGTAISLARALIVALENWQEEDGTVTIPEILRPYCGFDRIG